MNVVGIINDLSDASQSLLRSVHRVKQTRHIRQTHRCQQCSQALLLQICPIIAFSVDMQVQPLKLVAMAIVAINANYLINF